MARITVEDCLKVEPNRFQLVHMAIQRAKQILKAQTAGATNASVATKALTNKAAASPRSSLDKTNKPVVIALREIASGKVRLMTDAEAEELLLQQATLNIEDSPMTEADKILSRLGLSTQPDAVDIMLAEDSSDSNGKGDDDDSDDE